MKPLNPRAPAFSPASLTPEQESELIRMAGIKLSVGLKHRGAILCEKFTELENSLPKNSQNAPNSALEKEFKTYVEQNLWTREHDWENDLIVADPKVLPAFSESEVMMFYVDTDRFNLLKKPFATVGVGTMNVGLKILVLEHILAQHKFLQFYSVLDDLTQVSIFYGLNAMKKCVAVTQIVDSASADLQEKMVDQICRASAVDTLTTLYIELREEMKKVLIIKLFEHRKCRLLCQMFATFSSSHRRVIVETFIEGNDIDSFTAVMSTKFGKDPTIREVSHKSICKIQNTIHRQLFYRVYGL